MPEFIIHVGPHKTGTTYLQLSFKAFRPTMRKRGILYPDFWDFAPGNPSHLPLVLQLREGDRDRLAPRFAEIADANVRKVLISAEDLSILEEPALALLRELIGENPVRIVFYLRRWSDLLPSSWQESIKQGQTHTLPEYFVYALQRPAASPLLNYGLKISRLAEVFGLPNVVLVGYSELRDRKTDIFQHFCTHFLDWPAATPIPRLAAANASRQVSEVEILRGLNAMTRERADGSDDRMRRAFRLKGDAIDMSRLIAGTERFVTRLRFNDDWPILRQLHDDLVAKFHDSIMQPKRPGEIFRPKNVELRYVSSDFALLPGMAQEMNTLLDALLQE